MNGAVKLNNVFLLPYYITILMRSKNLCCVIITSILVRMNEKGMNVMISRNTKKSILYIILYRVGHKSDVKKQR